ncbi:MAG: hypothetical protein Q4C56_04245 [Peptococcaceae bacterium]|nr:hypothetical protein [Peptococcaceae bacterium]
MPTNTFERKIEIKDPASLQKLFDVMQSDDSHKPLSQHPFSDADRERSARLLKMCLSRSN